MCATEELLEMMLEKLGEEELERRMPVFVRPKSSIANYNIPYWGDYEVS